MPFVLAFRSLLKSKGHAFTNITGLTAALACCLLIFLFVVDEWRFDRFHAAHERIFRVTTVKTEDGVSTHLAHGFAPLAGLLDASFPGPKQVSRFMALNASVKNPANNVIFQEPAFFFADSTFFDIFDFDFQAGHRGSAFRQPNSIVLSQQAARRYFGDENPLGKTLRVEGEVDFMVTGVLKPLPGHSTLQFDFLASMKNARQTLGYEFDNAQRGGWYHPPVFTFVKFPDAAAAEAMKSGMAYFEQNHLPQRLRGRYAFQLQPLRDMHFAALDGDLRAAVNPLLLHALTGIALLILGIACANYINLTIARRLRRTRDVGIRKVLGASKGHIAAQSGAESAVVLLLSLLLAAMVAQILLPKFNALTDKQLDLFGPAAAVFWAGVAGVLLVATMLTSAFPLFFMGRAKLADILRSDASTGVFGRTRQGASLRSGFIVFQFSTAVALLVAALVAQQQLHFIRGKNLGVKTEQVMVIPVRDEALQNNFAAGKNRLAALAGVTGVSAISNFPWEKGFYDFNSTLRGPGRSEQTANLPTLFVDRDFIEVMGMTIRQGHSFAQYFTPDSSALFLLNETAARHFDIKQLDGIRLTMEGVRGRQHKDAEVAGIVADFHLKSLHHAVEPLAMAIASEAYYLDNFVLRLKTNDLSNTVSAIAKEWAKISPDRPFDYFFLDDAFEKLYRQESRLLTLFGWFGGLALLISCLGIFALAALISEQRTKEIGIRKVLGASAVGITGLLAKDFLKLVILAIVLASPVAYYFMQQWLADFAYRIDIQWWMFAVAGAAALAIAFLTVGFQSIRAALTNPVKSLRSE